MKKFKILSALIAFITAVSMVGCQETEHEITEETEPIAEEVVIVSPKSIIFNWQYPYEGVLTEFMNSENYVSADENGISVSMFDICDINSDGIPELIISPDTGSLTKCLIYTLSGTSATLLGELGTDGTIRYLADSGLLHDEYKSDSITIGKYVTFEKGEMVQIMSYTDNTASAASGAKIVHEVNGEELTLPEYDSALAEYENEPYIYIGRKYSFSSRTFEYGLRCSESWRSVMADVHKKECKRVLEEIYNTEGEENKAFELCDLNGDDVPELIVSSGTNAEDSCRIFYFTSDNVLTELNGTYGSNGILTFDIEKSVFYSKNSTETVYWSLKGGDFSAASYVSSGSVMDFGRKYLLNNQNIDYLFSLDDIDKAVISEEDENTEESEDNQESEDENA